MCVCVCVCIVVVLCVNFYGIDGIYIIPHNLGKEEENEQQIITLLIHLVLRTFIFGFPKPLEYCCSFLFLLINYRIIHQIEGFLDITVENHPKMHWICK
ncbi:MAG: hypothetical protein ACI8RD_008233 [Bacillariaceae sp.]|jgi:hypothetical protein